MSSKLSEKSILKRILVVSMTNIGDVVLSCPVIDILKSDFPDATIDVVVGPKAVSLFEDNPHLNIKMFDKRASLKQRSAWFLDLSREHYDCVVDLRRTMLGLFLRPKYATPLMVLRKSKGMHKKDIHLNRLRQVYDFKSIPPQKYAIVTTKADEQFFEQTVAPFVQGNNLVVVAPGAADARKRWTPKGFAAVADYLSATAKVVFVGDAKDAQIIKEIEGQMKSQALSLAGEINLRQLAFVLKKSSWVLAHDSGVMHLASYFNLPLVVLWGPTSIEKYAPWSGKSIVIRRNEQCPRCQDPQSSAEHNCMSLIRTEDVIDAINRITNKVNQ